MTYNRKMPKEVVTSEATRKALEAARTEKQRIAALEMESGLSRGIKKKVSVKLKHVGRTRNQTPVHR